MGRRPYHNLSHHAHSAPRRDNPRYEYAAATTLAPSPSSLQRSPAQEAAQMLRVVLSLIADACTSPLDAYYCVLRASGLTFRAIALRDGQMSHQAVHKRLRAICRREPVLLEYLCHDRRQMRHDQPANKETSNA